MQFDNRGQIISKSAPNPVLRTIKKVLHVDSADRDTLLYYTNGEFVVYLPRTYEKVVSIRLMSAEFNTLDLAYAHYYTNGGNVPGAVYSNDNHIHSTSASNSIPNYFLIEIDGLNKVDEAAVGANRSQYPDSFFAKIATGVTQKLSTGATGISTGFIEYNDHSGMENIAKYYPPIAKLDRLRIRTRLHAQQGSQGFIYWTLDSSAGTGTAANSNVNGANYCLTFEIEYLDNGFDNFSSMQTFLRDRPESS